VGCDGPRQAAIDRVDKIAEIISNEGTAMDEWPGPIPPLPLVIAAGAILLLIAVFMPVLLGALMLVAALGAAIATPAALYTLWDRHGRERKFTVPRYLSFVPEPTLKPWVVNMVFTGEPGDFDENGFYATVLDLYRRGFLEILPVTGDGSPGSGAPAGMVSRREPEGGHIRLRVALPGTEDPYEKRVLQFLTALSRGETVSTEDLWQMSVLARTDPLARTRVLQLKADLDSLSHVPDRTVVYRFLNDGREQVVPVLLLASICCGIVILSLILAPSAAGLLVPAVLLSGFAVAVAAAAWSLAPTVFGTWKGDYFKLKLEWDAFRVFLSDLALIRKYPPRDLSMWGEWLVFGTALGVGDSVVRVMKELDVQSPDVQIAPALRAGFSAIAGFAPSPGPGGEVPGTLPDGR
jgi:Predicted membrane protein (DUF2207) C-terminal domain